MGPSSRTAQDAPRFLQEQPARSAWFFVPSPRAKQPDSSAFRSMRGESDTRSACPEPQTRLPSVGVRCPYSKLQMHVILKPWADGRIFESGTVVRRGATGQIKPARNRAGGDYSLYAQTPQAPRTPRSLLSRRVPPMRCHSHTDADKSLVEMTTPQKRQTSRASWNRWRFGNDNASAARLSHHNKRSRFRRAARHPTWDRVPQCAPAQS